MNKYHLKTCASFHSCDCGGMHEGNCPPPEECDCGTKLEELWDDISEAGGGDVWKNLTKEQWKLSRDLFELDLK
mgnify:CR=1 FL=1